MATTLTTYLVGFKTGWPGPDDLYHPAGNSGLRHVHETSARRIRLAAQDFAKMHGLTRVYHLRQYPQELCEKTGKDFLDYVERHGERVV